MGLYEDMLARIRAVPPAAAFPDYAPAEEGRNPWDLPRLSDLPQNLRPPHLRSRTAAPAAESIGIQHALHNDPAAPAIPREFMVHAGMIPPIAPLDTPADMPAFNTPEQRALMEAGGADPGPTVPMPRGRPAEAPPATYPDDGSAPAPASMATPPGTDLSSRNRAPIQIAPPIAQPIVPAPAPAGPAAAVDPSGLPSILDRIRTGLSDHSNALLAIGAGFAGAPTFGQGISRAAAAAIPASAADLQQSLARQTQGTGYQALIEAGVPKTLARAAIGSPTIMKSVMENYLGDRKGQLVDIGFDRYGQPIKGIFDPFAKTIHSMDGRLVSGPSTARAAGGAPAAGETETAGTGTATDISAAKAGAPNPVGIGSGVPVTAENDITGPDFLERLKEADPAYARQVEQVIRGDAAMPTGRQAQTPAGKKLRQDVLTVEPGTSDADFNTRMMVRKSYAGGNDAKVTKSINTTLKHAQTLEKAINDMDNFSEVPILNKPRALVEGQFSAKYRKARAEYDTAVANFGKELDFAVSGGRPTVSGTKHQMEGFDATAAKDAQMAKLRTAVDLLKGRIDSHATGYAKGMKRAAEPIDFIDKPNREFYRRIFDDNTEPTGTQIPGVSAPAPAAAAGAAPAPGKYVFDPATGKMVPK